MPNLAASRLHEIWQETPYHLVNRCPGSQEGSFRITTEIDSLSTRYQSDITRCLWSLTMYVIIRDLKEIVAIGISLWNWWATAEKSVKCKIEQTRPESRGALRAFVRLINVILYHSAYGLGNQCLWIRHVNMRSRSRSKISRICQFLIWILCLWHETTNRKLWCIVILYARHLRRVIHRHNRSLPISRP